MARSKAISYFSWTDATSSGNSSSIGSSCRCGSRHCGLIADGETEVQEIQHIERGYSSLIEKLQGLGADIRKVSIPKEAIVNE